MRWKCLALEQKHPGLYLLWGKLTELMDAWRRRFLHWVTSGEVQHDGAGEAHEKVMMEKSPPLAPLSLLLVAWNPKPHCDFRMKPAQVAGFHVTYFFCR